MGITGYLSRDPIFAAPPAEDESELVIALIRSLNQQKNINHLKQAIDVINSESQKRKISLTRLTENKVSRQVDASLTAANRQSGATVKRRANAALRQAKQSNG